MSATNGTFYSEKSMNGIITLDDGMGAVIEGGEMTITDITADNIYCDNIQTKTNAEDAYLYTNTTGNIFIGTGAILNTNHIKCNDLQGEQQSDSVTLYTETTSGNIELGTGQDALSILKLGNQNNTNLIGGISVVNQAIEPDYLDQNMYVGSNLTTGNLIIANPLADVRLCGMTINNQDINAVDPNDTMGFGFNMGTTAYLTIGNSTNNNMIGNIHITGQTLTTEYPSQPVNLFNDLITSTLSFCGGMTSGIINMATAMTTGFVNIGTYMTVGAVNIGSATSNVLLNNSFLFSGNSLITQSASLALNLFNNITTATVSMLNGMTTGTFNLATNQTAGGNVVIGNFANTNRMGNFTYLGNAITSSGSNTLQLYNNQTHANGCNMLNGFTTATVNIANGLTTGILNLATALTTGTLNLGSSASSINVGAWRFSGFSIIATSNTATHNILTNLTNAVLNIATTMVGSINIGSSMSLGNITIGSQYTTNRIGNFIFQQNDLKTSTNSSVATYLFDNLTTATCHICNSMSSGTILIGSLMSSLGNITIGSSFSTINIGNFKFTGSFGMNAIYPTENHSILSNLTSGNLTIGAGQGQAGNTIFNKPIAMGYTTLGATVPASNQIGYTTGNLVSTASFTTGTFNVPVTNLAFTVPTGVWLALGVIQQITTSPFVELTTGFSQSAAFRIDSREIKQSTQNAYITLNTSLVITNRSATPAQWYLLAMANVNNWTFANSCVILTRLA